MSSTGKRKAPGSDVAEGKGAIPVSLPPMPSTHEVIPGTGETRPIPSAPPAPEGGRKHRRRTQKKRKMPKRKTQHRRR